MCYLAAPNKEKHPQGHIASFDSHTELYSIMFPIHKEHNMYSSALVAFVVDLRKTTQKEERTKNLSARSSTLKSLPAPSPGEVRQTSYLSR